MVPWWNHTVLHHDVLTFYGAVVKPYCVAPWRSYISWCRGETILWCTMTFSHFMVPWWNHTVLHHDVLTFPGAGVRPCCIAPWRCHISWCGGEIMLCCTMTFSHFIVLWWNHAVMHHDVLTFHGAVVKPWCDAPWRSRISWCCGETMLWYTMTFSHFMLLWWGWPIIRFSFSARATPCTWPALTDTQTWLTCYWTMGPSRGSGTSVVGTPWRLPFRPGRSKFEQFHLGFCLVLDLDKFKWKKT